MSKLRVGVIGYGQIGPVHLNALQQMDDVEIAAVCDLVEAKAIAAQRRFGAERYFTDYNAMLNWDWVDVIHVCIPTYLHADATIKAARAGKHVFCEKPMAMSLADAEKMIEACDRAGVKLGLGFCRRFDSQWLKFAEIVHSGVLGSPVVWRSVTAGEGAPTPWFFDREKGGGPFMDGAVHNYDFSRLLFGKVSQVKADMRRLRTGTTAMDTGTAILDYESGDQLVLSWSWGLPRGAWGAALHDVIGSKGALRFENPSKDPLVMDQTKRGALFVSLPGGEIKTFQYERNNMYFDEIRYFIDCIKTGATPKVSGDNGFEALRIALAVLEAGETGKVIRL